jgi:hypothetical protein
MTEIYKYKRNILLQAELPLYCPEYWIAPWTFASQKFHA